MFRRPLLLVIMAAAAVVVLGVLAIGAFPPSATPEAIERPVPAERFGTR